MEPATTVDLQFNRVGTPVKAQSDPMAVVRAGEAYAATQAQQEYTVPDLREKEFNVKELFGVGMHGTLIGQALQYYSSPDTKEQKDWRTPEDDKWLLANGYLADEYSSSIINRAANRTDLQYRIALLDDAKRTSAQLENATGVKAVAGYAAMFLGGMSTSLPEMVIGGLGAVAATSRIAGVTANTTRLALTARAAAGAVAAEIPSSALRQNIMQSEVFGSVVAEDMLFSAVFEVPVVALAVQRARVMQKTKAELGAAQETLVTALDEGADIPAVQAHAAEVQKLKDKIVAQAEKDGDVLTAEIYAKAGPDASPAEIDVVIRDMRIAEEEARASMAPDTIPDAVAFVRPDRAVDDIEAAEIGRFQRELMVERGVAVSPEAAQIVRRARTTWEAKVPESLQKMQDRLATAYTMRKDRLKDYGGIASWLDTPGLKFQLSNSAVTRMLGSLMVESGSGLGKRSYSAALDYEKMQTPVYQYVPALKEALLAHQVGIVSKGKMLVMGDDVRERTFWKDVQLDRLMRREHIKNKGIGEYVSTAPETVQKAGKLLDSFIKDEADLLKSHGHEEGDAILGGGFVGHIPYRIDSREVNRMYVEEPEKFEALRQLLQDQFHEKVLRPGLEDLNANRDKYVTEHLNNLRSTVASLQDKLASMEETRRAVQNIRDNVADVEGKRKTLVEQIRVMRDQEKSLKAELEELQSGYAQEAAHWGRTEEEIIAAKTAFSEDWRRFNMDEPMRHEIVRFDATEFLQEAATRFDYNSEEYVLALQLLGTMSDGATPASLVVRTKVDGNLGSYFSRKGNKQFISLRTSVTALRPDAPGVGPDMSAKTVVDRMTQTADRTELSIALHEFAHYRTSALLSLAKDGKADANVQAAYSKIEALRADVADLYKGRKDLRNVQYAVQDADEFVAQFFNSPEFRNELKKQAYKGKTAFNEFLDMLLDIIGVTRENNTMYNELHAAISTLLDTHTKVQTEGKNLHLAPESVSPRIAEIEQQLVKLKAAREPLEVSHKAVLEDTRAAMEVRAGIQANLPVKELKAIEGGLRMAVARLAEAEASPSVVFEKMRQQLTNKASTKSEDLTRKYLRQALTDQDNRVLGRELNFADMAQSILTENWEGDYITPKLAEQFRAKLSERVQDKTRTELDLTRVAMVGGKEVRLMDMMSLDGLGMVKSMGHSVAGKAALARKGMHDPVMQAAALEAMTFDGADPDTVAEMKWMFDVYADRADPGTNPEAWAALRNLTYAAKMGKLGEAMLADLPAAISLTGISALPRVFGGAARMMLDGSAFVYNKGLTPLGQQLVTDLPSAMGMDHRLHTDHTEGGAGMGAQSTKSFIARMASKGAQMTSILSLANTVSSVTHRVATPYIADELAGAVQYGKSSIPDARVADAGLGPNEIALIKKYMDKYDSGRKPGERINWDKWDGEEGQYAADVFIGSIHRATFQTVQKALSGEKPSFMQKTQLGRTVAQLHTYGMIAAEKQLARNLGHMDANTGLWMSLTLVWAAMLYLARTHANSLNHEESKRDEYIKQRLSGANLANGVFTMWNGSGLTPEILSVGMAMWGNKEDIGGTIQTHPRGGGFVAAAGFIGDVGEAASATGNWVRGVEDTKKMLKEVSQIVPGGNTRLVAGLLAASN